VRLVYASSAATYGDGSQGYDDRCDPSELNPLNLYGESKQQFDLWALEQVRTGAPTPAGWTGLKFFNVYGPRENHKGRMASVALHAYNQIKAGGRVKLFASDRPDVPDGGQMRDFVYVKDVVATVRHCAAVDAGKIGTLLNVGTGQMRSFADLARAVYAALGRPAEIEFIPMPADLKGRYQYFTEARIEKLRATGFTQPFATLEDGVKDYVRFLQQ
jgi:ADP-L-glycero-D-manno-heptose 6-epimerase